MPNDPLCLMMIVVDAKNRDIKVTPTNLRDNSD